MSNLRMGLFGLFVGYWLGSKLDEALEKTKFQSWHSRSRHTNWPKQMIQPMFSIMGYIAKLDGTVSPNSIRYAENMMKKMRCDKNLAKIAVHAFKQGKSPHFNLQQCLNQIRLHLMFNPTEQNSLLQNIIQIAQVDGQISPRKQQAIQEILASLGRGFQYRQYQHHQHQYQHSPQPDSPASLASAHQLLGTKPFDPLAVITKQYRKMLSKYHPDRIQTQKGRAASEQEIKKANENTHRIKQAYELIKQSKGG